MRDYSSISQLHGQEDAPQNALPVDNDNQPSAIFDPDQIWDPDQATAEDALLDDDCIFYGGGADFPPLLPDFPCMSSSSSSSSTPAPLKTAATMSCSSSSSASSSAASWAALRSDADNSRSTCNYNQIEMEMGSNNNNCYSTPSGGGALSSTASMEIPQGQGPAVAQEQEQGTDGDCCMDVTMDDFGYMDLLETTDFFDPSSIFQGDHQNLLLQDQPPHDQDDRKPTDPEQQQGMMMMMMMMDSDHQNNNNNNGDDQTTTTTATQLPAEEEEDDLGSVFLEWLKNNKENVSAEDLRRVKIKKSTIESAARRLGGGREAMKQLVKLVLEWVQTNHLQRRTTTTVPGDVSPNSHPAPPVPPPPPGYDNQPPQGYPLIHPVQNPPWVVPHYPGGAADLALGVSVGYPPNPTFGNPTFRAYPGDYNNHPITIESAQSWPGSQFATSSAPPAPYAAESNLGQQPGGSGQLHVFPGYPYPYLPAPQQEQAGDSNTLVRMGSSATKEARKKRMARQRRFLSHHHRNHHAAGGAQHQHGGGFPDHQVGPTSQQHANLVYWPPSHQGSSGPVAAAVDGSPVVQLGDREAAMQNQNPQRQGAGASDKRQGWKPEKNLRFLLQKVLKQSDVGNLGRIVLPKKEAETHLPELEARDGISIAMEDIATSRVWNMRYRFWPNNKSRMYLLENTGDFVRANGLQEGDFIVIYSDIKCGKYLIRGVKVRQPGFKPESKKATGKSQKIGSPSQAAAANALPVAQSQRQTIK